MIEIDQFEKIRELLSNTLVGREFVYLSKYGGETFGIVAGISLDYTESQDKETGRLFKVSIGEISRKVKLTEEDYVPVPVKRSWRGLSFETVIHSTNNIQYTLGTDEIYFI